jgi:hypothetical protein
MNLIDVLIPLVPGIVLIAIPQVLTPKTASPVDAAKRTSKTRKIGYVLVGVAVLYLFLILAQPHVGH